ncbi:metallophosphoesterase [Prescottella equi]|uniref:Calcineurin-like phosphoesterase family protein n=1 Tax=Rhodococcus phage REQ2 TaxID=1109713 RepID=G9FH15_9CAUD|nr:metallophosphoesterase [Prescottella equi]YP_005087116.1 metallophosphoesterase [Rhodococcus phage REQ2]AEV51926.1 calcineurin-like phosphoesterase family protein [Rhodococcus phage REQ2]
MNVYFTSDLHLGHERIAEHRGYPSSDAHDRAVLDSLIALPRDSQLWVLGDVTIGRRRDEDFWLHELGVASRIQRITMHLVPGNHDSCHPMHRDAFKHQGRFLNAFASVQAFARRKLAGQNVLLSHFPYRGDHTAEDRATQYRLRDEGLWLLHGHTHSSDRGPAIQTLTNWGGDITATRPLHKQIHVGWDAWNRPVDIDEIAAIINGEQL